MQPAHFFAFTLNNVITARSLVSLLLLSLPVCFPLDFLIFFLFFKCQEEDGLAVHLLTVSYIFPYEAIFCNDILILTIAREKGEEALLLPRSVDSITALLNSSPSCHYCLFIYFWLNYTLTVPSHLYQWRKTHTHLLLDWIKYDITKAQPAIFSKEGCTQVSLKIFFRQEKPDRSFAFIKVPPYQVAFGRTLFSLQ